MARLICRVLFVLLLALSAGGTLETSSYHKDSGVAVLCYHHLSTSPSKHPFTVRKARFAQQLEWLKRHGYRTIAVRELSRQLKHRDQAGRRVLITFDDPGLDFVKIAQPLLKKYGFTAVLLVSTNSITEGHRGGLSWAQLRAAMRAGHSVQSHSVSHPYLDRMSKEEQARQFAESRKKIEEKLGSNVEWLSFPFGTYTDDSRAALEAAGYVGAFTIFQGANDAGSVPFHLGRYVVLGHHTLADFSDRLAIGNLGVRQIQPPPGSRVSAKQLVELQLPAGLGIEQLRVTLGNRFVGNNPALRFHYNPDNGKLVFNVRNVSGRYLIATVTYLDQRLYQSSFLYLKR